MASILEDVRVFLGGADLALSLTKFSYETSTEEKDVTTFRTGTPASSSANTAKLVVGGLEMSSVKMEGNSEAGSDADEDRPDDLFWQSRGTPTPLTVAPDGSALGDVAFLTNLTPMKLITLGAPGDVWSYEVDGTTEATQRGQFLLPVSSVAADGDGTAMELGAVTAGQQLHFSAHVLAYPDGDSIVLSLESSADEAFTSPTTQLTTGSFTATGAELLSSDGSAVTDTWYRVSWDITGSSGSFVVVAAAAIY